MKKLFSSLLPFAVCFFLASCEPDTSLQTELTPEQMYEQANDLLKPHADREKPDYQGALKLLQEAANLGYLPAIIDLAGVYLEGSRDGIVKKDRQKAFQLYSLAASHGSAEALYYCGFILEAEKKYDEAFSFYQKAANAGLPDAKYRLGRLLLQKKDPAARPLIQAAAQSHRASLVADASYTMATIHQDGLLGVPADMNTAVKWYLQAADAGDARALHMVGLMYILGEYLPQDAPKGEALLRLSAGQDYVPAIEALIRYLFQKDPAAYALEIEAWVSRLNILKKK